MQQNIKMDRALLTSSRYLESSKYWKETLDGIDAPFVLRNPTADGRSCDPNARLVVSHTLSCKLRAVLSRMAKGSGYSEYVILLSCLALLLSKYTSARKVSIVAPPIKGPDPQRSRQSNRLIVSDMSQNGSVSIRDFILMNRESFIKCNDEMSFQEEYLSLVEMDLNKMSNVKFRHSMIHDEFANVSDKDLLLSVDADQEHVRLEGSFSPSYFTESFVKALLVNLEYTMLGFQSPEKPLREVGYLSPDRTSTSKHEAGSNASPELSFLELFQRCVEAYPDQIALNVSAKTTSYRELGSITDKIAGYLARNYQVNAGDTVLILVKTDDLAIMSTLGVLRSGAVVAMMDDTYPDAIVDKVIRSAKPKLIITELEYIFKSFNNYSGDYCVLDVELPIIAEASDDLPELFSPNNIAYSVFGSILSETVTRTDISQAELSQSILALTSACDLSKNDVFMPIGDSISNFFVTDYMLPLSVGAKILLSEDYSTQGLLDAIDKMHPTVMRGSLKDWRLFFESGWSGDKRLKVICVDGWITKDASTKLMSSCRGLWNLYGSPETAMCFSVTRVVDEFELNIISKVNPGSSLSICNVNGEAVPFGVEGEVLVKGPTTCEPFRTGYNGVLLDDGRVRLLNGSNQRYRVRGIIPDLTKIEGLISKRPDIKDVAVVIKEGSDGIRYMVAYLVASCEIDLNVLRMSLSQALPVDWIPAFFEYVKEIPRSRSGAPNLQALPKVSAIETDQSYAAPRTEVERTLVRIWERVLGRDNIGIDDNFFLIGGNSLNVMQVIHFAQTELNIKVSLNFFFTHPSIRMFVGGAKDLTANEYIVPLNVVLPGKRNLFLVPPGIGSPFAYKKFAGLLNSSYNVYGMLCKGFSSDEEFDSSVERMSGFFMELIRKVQPHGPYTIGGYSMGVKVGLETVRMLEAEDEEVCFIAIDGQTDNEVGEGERFDLSEFSNNEYFKYIYSNYSRESLNSFVARVERLVNYNLSIVRAYDLRPGLRANIYCISTEALFPMMSKLKHITSGNFEIRTVNGNHISIFNYPHVIQLAGEINKMARRSTTVE